MDANEKKKLITNCTYKKTMNDILYLPLMKQRARIFKWNFNFCIFKIKHIIHGDVLLPETNAFCIYIQFYMDTSRHNTLSFDFKLARSASKFVNHLSIINHGLYHQRIDIWQIITIEECHCLAVFAYVCYQLP
jgi:hypothetical protein